MGHMGRNLQSCCSWFPSDCAASPCTAHQRAADLLICRQVCIQYPEGLPVLEQSVVHNVVFSSCFIKVNQSNTFCPRGHRACFRSNAFQLHHSNTHWGLILFRGHWTQQSGLDPVGAEQACPRSKARRALGSVLPPQPCCATGLQSSSPGFGLTFTLSKGCITYISTYNVLCGPIK